MDLTSWANGVISIMVIPAIVLTIIQIILMLKVRNKFIKLIPVYIVGAMLIAIFAPGIFVNGWYKENNHVVFLLLTSPIYVFLSIPWLVIAIKRRLATKSKAYDKPYDEDEI